MNCSTWTCKTRHTAVGVIRILLGIAMIAFWVMKLGANAEMIEMVGSAWAAMWLDFLSTTTWFWIAVVGEILAWILLLTWCKLCSKIWAVVALIIMVFAVNAVWFNLNAILVIIFALVVLVFGPGKRCFCTCKACKKWGCCGTGTCNTQTWSDMQQQ